MIDDEMQPHDSLEPSEGADALESLVRAAAPTSFDRGFSERVMGRMRAERNATVSDALDRQFRRVVPMLAAASLLLAAYNWWGGRATASSAIDAALNLPQVSLASAYSAASLLDLAAVPSDQSGMP